MSRKKNDEKERIIPSQELSVSEGELSQPQAAELLEPIVKIWPANAPLTPYNPTNARRVSSSLRLDDTRDKIVAYRAVTGQEHRAEDVLGQIFQVKHWLMHDVEKANDQTGEIEKWVRTVLVCEDGTRVSCGSSGVLSSIMSLSSPSFFGPAPWAPALALSIDKARSRNSRDYYLLSPH